MPTFTAIALDRLLEPGASRNPTMRPPLAPGKVEKAPPSPSEKKSIPRPNVSPALYATPETTPLPDSPSSFPPSPYIINHKRRGPRLLKSFSQNDVAGSQPLPPPEVEKKIAMVNGKGVEETANGFHDEKLKGEQKDVDGNGTRGESVSIELHQGKLQDDGSIAAKEVARPVAVDLEKDGESEDFFDLQDSLSTTSNTELDERWKPSTPLGEYFDAFEEMARQQRHRRKKRQKWIWGSIGLAVSLGAAAIAWSYFPVSKPSPPEGNTIDSHEH